MDEYKDLYRQGDLGWFIESEPPKKKNSTGRGKDLPRGFQLRDQFDPGRENPRKPALSGLGLAAPWPWAGSIANWAGSVAQEPCRTAKLNGSTARGVFFPQAG